MASIKDTVTSTLGFHGQTPNAVHTSIIDALEIREAQIQADLLLVALDLNLDEDEALQTLHDVFQHVSTEPTGSAMDRLDVIRSLVRVLAQQVDGLTEVMDVNY